MCFHVNTFKKHSHASSNGFEGTLRHIQEWGEFIWCLITLLVTPLHPRACIKNVLHTTALYDLTLKTMPASF